MASFQQAIEEVLKNEGGYVNNPKDPGGPTNYGISAKYLMDANKWQYDFDGDGVIGQPDMVKFTEKQAIDIYRKDWWDRYGFDRIDSDRIANKLFDMSVNMGSATAFKLMQSAYNSLLPPVGPHIEEDGVLGPITVQCINQYPKEYKLLNAFKIKCIYHYRYLADKNPSLSIFLNGWQNRVYS